MKVIKLNLEENSFESIDVQKAIVIVDMYYQFYIYFINNRKVHNSKFHAEYILYNNYCIDKYYHYYNTLYPICYSNKSWKKQVKYIKRENKLNIFI